MATTAPASPEEEGPSTLVREYLDGSGGPRSGDEFGEEGGAARPRLRALRRIDASLRSCLDGDAGEEARRLRREWRSFLEGSGGDADDTDADGEVESAARDELVARLAEGCRPADEDDGVPANEEDDGSDADDDEAREASLRCLARLVRLRCSDVDDAAVGGSRASSAAPIFGPDFVAAVAPGIVAALRAEEAIRTDGRRPTSSRGAAEAASDLLAALLRPDRPRSESSVSSVRDAILLPACDSTGDPPPAAAAARVAEVLARSVVASVERAVPEGGDDADRDELSMRRETAALNQLQDVRDVMARLGRACARGLEAGEGSIEGACSERILAAFGDVYDVAAFALESQLEALLDDAAGPILARLREGRGEGRGEAGVGTNRVAGSARSMMTEDADSDLELDAAATAMEEACALPPLYDGLARPPLETSSLKDLDSTLCGITESLKRTDAEAWDERLEALVDLECLLAGGVASQSADARHLFVERLRKAPFPDQFVDLRSQITQQACRVLVAFAYEYRSHVAEDPQLHQSASHLAEFALPSVLDLCKSGTRLMSNQGVDCLLRLAAASGPTGYPRLVPKLCDEVLGKRVHAGRKKGCVVALSAALRVWDPRCFARHGEALEKATKQAATDRDPGVRTEGRRLYWAMRACAATARGAEGLFDARTRDMKNLEKERAAVDAEWGEDGALTELVRTGVLDERRRAEASEKEARRSRVSAPRPSKAGGGAGAGKRPASAGARLRVEHGTPFKAHRLSTPVKAVGAALSGRKTLPLGHGGSQLSTQVAAGATSGRKTLPPGHGGARLRTPGTKSRGTSPVKFSENRSINRARGPAETDKAGEPRAASSSFRPARTPGEGKENAPSTALRTPARSVGFNVNIPPPSPVVGTPVVNLLARASPLSAERAARTGDVLGEILSTLEDDGFAGHERVLGVKALALFAREEPNHPSWDGRFDRVLACLLDRIRDAPTDNALNDHVDFIRSPSKSLGPHRQVQHLFLQGVRALLQFVPMRVGRDQARDVIDGMLECTKNAPFDIVHTAERALFNLVQGTDPETCLGLLLPYATTEGVDLLDRGNPPALLSTLRTLRHLAERVSLDSLRRALSSLLPLSRTLLDHKSVDMRKAAVFVLVELRLALGPSELALDGFTDCQRRLIEVYVDRHPRNTRAAGGAVPHSDGVAAQSIVT